RVGFVPIGQQADQGVDVVTHGEKEVGQVGVEADVTLAHLVEHVLGDMGEGHDPAQAEDAGRALDGVGGAEDRVDDLGVVRVLFDLEQGLFHAVEQVLAFGDESQQGFVEVHATGSVSGVARPANSPATSMRRRASVSCGGAAIRSSAAPRWRASRKVASSSCTPAPSTSETPLSSSCNAGPASARACISWALSACAVKTVSSPSMTSGLLMASPAWRPPSEAGAAGRA